MEKLTQSFSQDTMLGSSAKGVRPTKIGPRSVRLPYETNAPFCRRTRIDPCNLESSMLLFKRGAFEGPTGGIMMTQQTPTENGYSHHVIYRRKVNRRWGEAKGVERILNVP